MRDTRSAERLGDRPGDVEGLGEIVGRDGEGDVGEALLGRMKPGSYLVNTARGAVIDVDALVRVMEQDRLAAVGLDVLPIEPINGASPLLADRRVMWIGCGCPGRACPLDEQPSKTTGSAQVSSMGASAAGATGSAFSPESSMSAPSTLAYALCWC